MPSSNPLDPDPMDTPDTPPQLPAIIPPQHPQRQHPSRLPDRASWERVAAFEGGGAISVAGIAARQNPTTLIRLCSVATGGHVHASIWRSRRHREEIMKYVAITFAGLTWLLFGMQDAIAVVCARGYNRAGCVSRHGSIGVGPGGAVAVGPHGRVYSYRRGSRCYWAGGRQICP
jgi:hypothetical protein